MTRLVDSMVDGKKHLDDIPPRKFSDETIRQFLFAQLGVDEQAAFEDALFTDPKLERRARLAEIELTDNYVFGKLNTKQCRLFHENFLLSGGRRNALEVSTALRAQLTEASDSPSLIGRSRALLLLRHPGWKFAFASLILVLLLAGVWLVTKDPQLVRQIIHPRARPAAISTPMPEVAHHGTDSAAAPVHHDEPSQSPEHEVGVQRLVLRQASEPPATLTIIGGTTSVRFELAVEHPLPMVYRADLTTHDGEVLYTVEQALVTDGAGQVSFDVPVGKLKTGDFQVKLTQVSDGKLIASYNFRVQ